jgi:long-chain acyl-CoA synthetase
MFKTSGGKYICSTNHWKHNETIRFIDQIMVIGDEKCRPHSYSQFWFPKEWGTIHGVDVGVSNIEIISNEK